MARLALSVLFLLSLLSLLSLSLGRFTPDQRTESEFTSITPVETTSLLEPQVKPESESSEGTTHYVIIPVERFSGGRSFENVHDFGFSLRHPIGHGHRHHHHHGFGGFGHRLGHRFGHRFMAGHGRDMDVKPAWMKPDGEWMEMPRVPMHMKHWEEKEMKKGEEYVKASKAEEPEEDELNEEEMEKLRELMKKMRKKCRKHRMEREREMRISHGYRHEKEVSEEKVEREMHMPRRPRFEKEEKEEKKEGGFIKQVWDIVNRF